MRDRQILVFIGGERSRGIDTAVICLLYVILIDHLRRFTPAHEVEEPLALHRQFQTAFHLDFGKCVRIVGIGFYADLGSVVGVIPGKHANTARCTVTELVNQFDGLLVASQLSHGLSTHQQHVCVANHDTVHRRTEPQGGTDEVTALRINVVFQSHVITIQTIGTTPVMRTAHDEVRVELIRETGYTYRQPETGIGIVGRSIEILVVERVDEGQPFGVGTESVYEVLTRLVEITTAIRHAFDTRYHQAVRPVTVT